MLSYALRRITIVAITLLAASVIVFAVLEIVPGDPARLMLGMNANEDAVAALRSLIALRREGLQQPLPFAPYSGWELFATRDDVAIGLKKAAGKWRGNERGWAEGDIDAIRLALRGRDPFLDAASLHDFARISGIVFGAVTRGMPMAIELADAPLPDDDREDAA